MISLETSFRKMDRVVSSINYSPFRVSIIHSPWKCSSHFAPLDCRVTFSRHLQKTSDSAPLKALPDITVPDVMLDISVIEEIATVLTKNVNDAFVSFQRPPDEQYTKEHKYLIGVDPGQHLTVFQLCPRRESVCMVPRKTFQIWFCW